MNNFSSPQLDPLHPRRHLQQLQTPFGARSVYDSISFCNRCGSCQQACPTFLQTAQEPFSPRGRNQAARLIAERKLTVSANRELLEKMVNSCLLCGRCTQACAGKIPTAQHMLELRRTLHTRALPFLLHTLLSWRSRHPARFGRWVKMGLFLRRWGAVKIGRLLGLTRVGSLRWINHADDILPRKRDRQAQARWKEFLAQTPQTPTMIYLPSLEAEFFMPQLACSVLQTAQNKHRVRVWTNTASGLFEYVYGDLRQSRRQVRRLIKRWEQEGRLPLLTDSVDVYLFLRAAGQLFDRWPRWQQKADSFARQVRFVTDVLPKKLAAPVSGRVRLDAGALFLREGEPFDSARKILRTHFKKNFVECFYKDADAPAFGYSFVRYNLAAHVWTQAVRSAARTQTGTVFTLSGLSALELGFYLGKLYPYAKADHLARLNG